MSINWGLLYVVVCGFDMNCSKTNSEEWKDGAMEWWMRGMPAGRQDGVMEYWIMMSYPEIGFHKK